MLFNMQTVIIIRKMFFNVNSGNICLHSDLYVLPKKDTNNYVEIKRIIVCLKYDSEISDKNMEDILNIEIKKLKAQKQKIN